jgi:hypothetical protein
MTSSCGARLGLNVPQRALTAESEAVDELVGGSIDGDRVSEFFSVNRLPVGGDRRPFDTELPSEESKLAPPNVSESARTARTSRCESPRIVGADSSMARASMHLGNAPSGRRLPWLQRSARRERVVRPRYRCRLINRANRCANVARRVRRRTGCNGLIATRRVAGLRPNTPRA